MPQLCGARGAARYPDLAFELYGVNIRRHANRDPWKWRRWRLFRRAAGGRRRRRDVHRPRRTPRRAQRARSADRKSTRQRRRCRACRPPTTPTAVGPVDIVLFAVKLYDTEGRSRRRCRRSSPRGPGTLVVPLQNGVDSVDTLDQGRRPCDTSPAAPVTWRPSSPSRA